MPKVEYRLDYKFPNLQSRNLLSRFKIALLFQKQSTPIVILNNRLKKALQWFVDAG